MPDPMFFHDTGHLALADVVFEAPFPQAGIRIFLNIAQDFGHNWRIPGLVNSLWHSSFGRHSVQVLQYDCSHSPGCLLEEFSDLFV